MCKNPQVDTDRPAVAELMADAAAAVARRAARVSEDVYEVIIRGIPQLRDDKPVLALLASSVDSNVDTCLQIMQHWIDLTAVRAPAAAVEYARRLAQRGTPLTALLRAYRVGHACFSDWMLTELARQTDEAEMISATTLDMSRIVAGFRITHQQAVAAQAVALAAGSPGPRTVTFSEVAPVAMMLGSPELLSAWVLGTLGPATGSARRCCGPRPRRLPWVTINRKAMATVVALPGAMVADAGGAAHRWFV